MTRMVSPMCVVGSGECRYTRSTLLACRRPRLVAICNAAFELGTGPPGQNMYDKHQLNQKDRNMIPFYSQMCMNFKHPGWSPSVTRHLSSARGPPGQNMYDEHQQNKKDRNGTPFCCPMCMNFKHPPERRGENSRSTVTYLSNLTNNIYQKDVILTCSLRLASPKFFPSQALSFVATLPSSCFYHSKLAFKKKYSKI